MIDCPHLVRSLADELSPEAQAHLDGCRVCQQARAAFGRLGAAEPPKVQAGSLPQLVQAELARHPKVWPWWVEALGAVAVNAMIAFAMVASMKWNTVQHSSPSLRWGVTADLVLLVLGGAVAAFAPRARVVRWAVVGLAGFAALATLWGASGNDPGGTFFGGAGCGMIELGASVLPLGVALWLATRMAPDISRAMSFSVAAGAAALLALHLHCPNGTFAHLLTFHLLPWALLSGVAWLARRALPTKSYAP